MSLLGQIRSETIDIERPGPPTRDSTGAIVPGPPVRIRVEGCGIVSPYGVTIGSSTETHDASTTVETDRVLIAPIGTDVRPEDTIIRATGERWQVRGKPNIFPFTNLAHVAAALKEVTG